MSEVYYPPGSKETRQGRRWSVQGWSDLAGKWFHISFYKTRFMAQRHCSQTFIGTTRVVDLKEKR